MTTRNYSADLDRFNAYPGYGKELREHNKKEHPSTSDEEDTFDYNSRYASYRYDSSSDDEPTKELDRFNAYPGYGKSPKHQFNSSDEEDN